MFIGRAAHSGCPKLTFPWLSLRKEDGYGDIRFHPPVPVDHWLRPLPGLLSDALERRRRGIPPTTSKRSVRTATASSWRWPASVLDDVEIVQEQNRLTVRGQQKDAGDKAYLYRGIATRAFERDFDLADHVDVTDASLERGSARHLAEARGAGGAQAAKHPDQCGDLRAAGPHAGRRAAQPRRSPPPNSRVAAKPHPLAFRTATGALPRGQRRQPRRSGPCGVVPWTQWQWRWISHLVSDL